MCYSAQVVADYKKLSRQYRARIDFDDFVDLYAYPGSGARPKTPRAMDRAFDPSDGARAADIAEAVEQWDQHETSLLEKLIFEQRKRLADAERVLQTKETKKALNDRRVATNKISQALRKLTKFQTGQLKVVDSRIFPGVFAPVIVHAEGQRVIRPMRYQCRLAGKPASYDARYPGTYNARRSSLEGYWNRTFGYNHAVLVVKTFYEHVAKHALEGRELATGETEESVTLEFCPEPEQEMIVACLWSEWNGPGGRLLSFAAITDEPPPEVAAAGHDRCIIQLKSENVDAWLNPNPADLAASYALLDDRPRPFYEHRLAA
jgi:putative SOS response-associated peptidase YedK